MLTENEKKIMAKKIKEFNINLQKEIEDQYPDDYKQTPMMDPAITQSRNEILRKIKFFQAKKLNLPNFIRRTREAMIAKRLQRLDNNAQDKDKKLFGNRKSTVQPQPLNSMRVSKEKAGEIDLKSRKTLNATERKAQQNEDQGEFVGFLNESLNKRSLKKDDNASKHVSSLKTNRK